MGQFFKSSFFSFARRTYFDCVASCSKKINSFFCCVLEKIISFSDSVNKASFVSLPHYIRKRNMRPRWVIKSAINTKVFPLIFDVGDHSVFVMPVCR